MSILLRLIAFSKKYWKQALASYICLLASTGLAIAIPWIIKEAIDVGLMKREYTFLMVAALAVVAASVTRGIFAYWQSYLGEFVSQHIAYDIRSALYDRLQRLSFSFHDKAHTGQLMSRATADVEGVRWFVSFGSLRAAYMVVVLAGICCLLVSLNWRLAMVSLACLPLVGFRAVTVGLKLRPIWLNIQQGIGEMGTILQENLSGMRVVKAFWRSEFESQKFGEKARKVYEESLSANRQQAFNIPLMTFILTLIVGVVLWYGGREVIAGRLTIGGLSAFIAYLGMLAMPVQTLGFIANVFSRAISSGERIFDILDADSTIKDAANAVELRRIEGDIRFEDVSFSYDSASPVLKNISFEARPGDIIALVGASGSGKSTIVNLIPRFYDVTGGRITIDGKDIREVTLASLRRNIGIVQQDVFLFSATIRDNIAYGAEGASFEQVVAAAKAAYLHHFIEGLPRGYDTWVGERGITLSGGQKQRVAIARTLLLDPHILILDDSTSSVDAETEYHIQQVLAKLIERRTTFIIAHRLTTLKRADYILVLKEGEIVEQGKHADLLGRNGIYSQIYRLQLIGQEEALEKGMSC